MKRESPSVEGAAHVESRKNGRKIVPKPSREHLSPIVCGIGASAGGLEALQSFLTALLHDDRSALERVCFVVVFHLDPSGGSLLPEIIARHSTIEVEEAADGVELRAGKLYLAPAGQLVGIENGVFRLASPDSDHRRIPIDYCLTSLAKDRRNLSIGIVLSGTGSDGASGLKTIGDSGGMTMVQDPKTAKFSPMPTNAIDTFTVDNIGAPEVLARELSKYVAHFATITERGEEVWHQDVATILPAVCDILLESKGHDFKHYKTSTLLRRTLRRLQVLRLNHPSDYVTQLRKDAAEVNALFNDLLINVTAFFRDPDAFESLAETVLKPLLAQKGPVRIWVPGCASGEEAYTLAMLICELIPKGRSPKEVQIFATDIDEEALSIARSGKYSLGAVESLTPERRQRFFVKRGQMYHVTKDIRELCLFSVHNLINDPPFSKLDLISCRNLLIYFGAHLQKKLIPLFHFALREGGYLFLGPSESLSTHRELFKPTVAKYRISQRLPTAIPSSSVLDKRSGSTPVPKPPNAGVGEETDLYLMMQRIVLDEFAPKSAIVDEDGQIRCASGNLERYLTVSAGAFHNNIVHLTRDELRVGLRAALSEAVAHRRKIVHNSLSVRTEHGLQRVSVTVQPMPQLGTESGLFLVLFQDLGEELGQLTNGAASSIDDASRLIDQLERELVTTRGDLERTIQEVETANEELKSSNEELLSMNEELQSSNEELETSKEETQAVNESLESVNLDLENLLASTQIATLFLEADGRIRRLTPAITEIYNLQPTDIGRELTDFTHRAVDMPPLPNMGDLLRAPTAFDEEIRLNDGRWFLRRVRPYEGGTEKLSGTVVTFTDISALKDAEARLARSEARLRMAVVSARLGVWGWDAESDLVTLDERAAEIFGIPAQPEITWAALREFLHEEDRERARLAVEHSLRDRSAYSIEYRVQRPGGSSVWVLASGGGFYGQDGQVLGMFGVVADITDRRNAEELISASERLYRAIGESINYGVWVCDADGRNVYASDSFLKLVGITQQQCSELGWADLLHPDDVEDTVKAWQDCVRLRTTWDREHRFRGADGNWHHLLARGVPVFDDKGELIQWAGINLDINKQKRTEAALRASEATLLENDRRKDEFLAMLAHELRNPLAAIRNALDVKMRAALTDEAKQRWSNQVLSRQVAHLSHLVDDLLDLPRITSGKIQLRSEPLDFNSIARGAVSSVSAAFEERNHQLQVEIPNEPLPIVGDATRLEQVLVNLFSNAAKYTPEQGKIGFSVWSDDKNLYAEVEDNGVGIAPEQLQRIFEPFAQVESSLDRSHGGLGLGLTLVQLLLELHGGQISAFSEGVGTGSKFRLTLPLASHSNHPLQETAAQPEEPAQLDGMKVLIVDDNVDSAQSAKLLLELSGCEVEIAHDGPSGMKAAEELQPDVLILDIGLPGMNGYELAEQLRSQPAFRDKLFLAVSGYGQAEDRRRSQQAGFDVHLLKPVDFDELNRLMAEHRREKKGRSRKPPR
ncbi:MAG: CheR family methyltransferase [Bdellovibrionota bacterium]